MKNTMELTWGWGSVLAFLGLMAAGLGQQRMSRYVQVEEGK